MAHGLLWDGKKKSIDTDLKGLARPQETLHRDLVVTIFLLTSMEVLQSKAWLRYIVSKARKTHWGTEQNILRIF